MSNTYTVKRVPIRSISAVEAVIEHLKSKGIRCGLEKNAIPRNYYTDQFRKHLNRPNEIADYVIRLKDSAYDVSLLQDPKHAGVYYPYFDPHNGHIEKVLGTEQQPNAQDKAHVIGKFLSAYSRQVALDVVRKQGLVVESLQVNPDYSWSAIAAPGQ